MVASADGGFHREEQFLSPWSHHAGGLGMGPGGNGEEMELLGDAKELAFLVSSGERAMGGLGKVRVGRSGSHERRRDGLKKTRCKRTTDPLFPLFSFPSPQNQLISAISSGDGPSQ